MAKGYTLLEMLAVLAVAPLLMVLISGFFRGFIRDIPQSSRLVQQNTTVLNLLDQLRRDMDKAVALPSQAGDVRADDATLLIEQPDALVCYRFEEGRTLRSLLGEQGKAAADAERLWQARDAVVEWRSWTRGADVRAVEVHSHLKQQVAGQARRRFAGSHVFFVGGLASGGSSHE